MTHELSRQNSGSGNSLDRGQLLLAALIALALLASVIMLLTDSTGALKIALIAALWAAIIGFFLVYRSQKQVESSGRELEAQDAAHRSELERQAAEAESRRLAQEVEHERSLREQDNETLRQIREQLADMHAQLAELSGREWGYEPTMLHAEARRIMELESEQYRREHVAVVPEPEHVTPEPEPVVAVDPPKPEPRVEQVAVAPEPEPEPAPAPEPAPEPESRVRHRAPEATPAPAAEEQPRRRSRHATPEDTGGRRRKDERSGGVSVADLLASARKREQS